MSSFIIRRAKRSDLGALAEIEAMVFASDRISPRSFRRLAASPSAALRVAEDEGGIAGYSLVLLRAHAAVGRLYSIAVHPRRRRMGLAGQLLDDAERTAAGRRCRVLRLEVRADNAAAIRLYERSGYRPIGRVPGYYADGAAALRYEKALPGPPPGETDTDPDRAPGDGAPISSYMSARRSAFRRRPVGRRISLPIRLLRQPACRQIHSPDASPPRRPHQDRGR